MQNMRSRPLMTKIVSVAFLLLTAAQFDTHAATPDATTPDGGRYYGTLLNGKLHGHGKLEWDNGAKFEGRFENGLYSGKGKFQSSSGYIYEGDFKQGRMDGQARYVMPDGVVYVGQFANDIFNGQGRYEMANGQIYEGAFVNGQFHGKGHFKTGNEEYVGQFKKNLYSGQGEIKYTDGRKYKGEFADGTYHGKGRYELADGQVYEGDFDKGAFTGNGTYHAKEGARHTGAFRKWKPHGAGTFTDARGNLYEGTYTDGDLSGKGKKTEKGGGRYEGEFKNWTYHGKGNYRFANGDEYKGGFSYGTYEGEGTFTYAKPQKDGRTKDSGTWRYGTLENKEKEKQTKRNVEAAIYNQHSLLDQALAALAPREPGKINLYFLAIAGDGSQEVFHREAEFIQNQFDRDYGTKTRSLALINSRHTVTTKPMATLTSIRASIAAIASRMDKGTDILFVYLTSHGSKNHEFVLDQNGMDLPGLEAGELGKILRESGIRWKVVVVSACYAGGFIAPLKDDHSLVIAAARYDRTSFGCADENDFTYFGRAYFKEALPVSTSFTDAFSKAKSLVGKWEADDLKNGETEKDNYHSEPQIHIGPKVEQHLQKWWKAQNRASPQAAGTKSILPIRWPNQ